jgi:hypothetical protein
MPAPGPLVRGRHVKLLLATVERHALGAAVRARIGPDSLHAIVDSSGLDWLPVEHDLVLTRAIYEALGPIAADRLFRDHTLASFEGPVLQTMVHTAVRLFGLDPASWARWVPKGWSLLFRGCGDWTVGDARAGQVTLTLAALPSACARDESWIRSVGHSLGALLDLARVRGVVEVAPRAEGASEAIYRLRWARGAGGDAERQP